MRIRIGSAALLALALVVNSCTDSGPVSPGFALRPQFAVAAPMPAVRISELHYDNSGTDTGERIEISGPAGTDLTGYSIVLYNGSGGAAYNTRALSGTIPALCGSRGVLVFSYPTDGIQNGSPDGIALAGPAGLIEFLTYEGSFTAVGGVAAGVVGTDIGVAEVSTTPVGHSLQRDSLGVWQGPAANTFGACKDDGASPPAATVESVTVSPATATIVVGASQAFVATAYDASNKAIAGAAITWTSAAPGIATVDAAGVATGVAEGEALITATAANGKAGTASLRVSEPPVTLPEIRLVELHYDNSGTDAGEAIEIEGPAGASLNGWRLLLYNGNGGVVYNTVSFGPTSIIPASPECGTRGVLVVDYPTNGIQNGGSTTAPEADGFALVNAAGAVVEFFSYEGVLTATDGPAAGTTSTNIGVSQNSAPNGQSLQRNARGVWEGPKASSFEGCNANGPVVRSTITFSGRDPVNDPALPVGFQDQLFATLRDGSGAVVPTTFTWSSDTPLIAHVDANGVVTATGIGSAVIRATAATGKSATVSLPTRVATPSPTAQYGVNADFGIPTDADASDDFVVTREQFTYSYSRTRGTPNWVSYNIDATHFGAEDRCDCFTPDPMLPQDFPRYTTADYTGAGAFHGYGIDRGHLARSFDRTAGSLDNATTFYFSNIIPQAADNNQGPWAQFENYLGDFARNQDRDVFVVAGVAGAKGTVKDEGKIVIPEYTWKVAVIMPRNQGVSDVRTYGDLDRIQYVAVIMPNTPGIRNVSWETYRRTVDQVETLSGYDVLDLLPDHIETALESDTRPPVAVLDGPYASDEGSAVQFDASRSTDRDGDVLTYEWSFGDGVGSGGVSATHTYSQDGGYTVRLIVTDVRGLADTATTTATVRNVAPLIGAFAGAELLPGETYSANGSFADPGADSWSGTVNYGDGSGTSALALSGRSFALSHRYMTAGSFTVAVNIADDDATSTRMQGVTVLTPLQALEQTEDLIRALHEGGVTQAASTAGGGGTINSLLAKVNAASASIRRGSTSAAIGQLGALLNELDAMVRSGRVQESTAAPVETMVNRVIRSISL